MASTGLRNLGRSGLRVSPLCLGAMNFGNEQFGCDEKASIAIIHAYLNAGQLHRHRERIFWHQVGNNRGQVGEEPARCRRHRNEGGVTAGTGSV